MKILLVGLEHKGLVHISELANHFVSNQAEVVKLPSAFEGESADGRYYRKENRFFVKAGNYFELDCQKYVMQLKELTLSVSCKAI